MHIKIAIADKNLEYANRMLNVMEGYEGVSISVYTDEKALEQALVSKQIDVLLFDSSVFQGQVELQQTILAIMLLDEDKTIPENCKDFRKIKKYQRVSRIYQQILDLYAEVCGDAHGMIELGKVTTIAFYSPVGGVGKTTLSLAAATKFALQGYRTFYLNLEDIASENCYLPQNAAKGLSELAAHLGENVNFSMKIQGLLQNKMEKLYYLNHFNSPNDFYEMTCEEMGQLLEQIQKSGLFDIIVIDMSTMLDSKLQTVFEYADRIVVVEKPDSMALAKINCFFGQTHIMNAFGPKMSRVFNFDMEKVSDSHADKVQLIGRIGAVQNLGSAQLISVLVNSPAMDFINRLI